MPIDVEKELLDRSSIDLNTSPNLPECPPAEGMSPDTLSAATKAALTTGFQTDVVKDTYKADGTPHTLEFEQSGGADPADHQGGDPTTGFLGRTSLLSER